MTSKRFCYATLHQLLAAVRRSPIIVRAMSRILYASDWASMRKSPHVDAFVLAWIASHVHEPRYVPRRFI